MPAENVTVNANFEIIGYTVAAVVNPVGAGTVEGTGVYNFGDAVTLTASANTGYQFVNWTDSENQVLGTELTYAFSMPAGDVTVNAIFELINEFTVTFNLTHAGSPVQGANITFDEQELVTDENGAASFILANGTYDYLITKEGYEDAQGQVVVDGSDKLVEIEMISGISSEGLISIMVYPNPAQEQINLVRSHTQPVTLEMYTDNGKLVRTESWTTKELKLNIQELKSGLYMIQISDNGTVKTLKFIKQ